MWQTFKNVFKERFKDSHTDQYHFMQLQTAKHQKGESPQTFADRCRMLAQKVMRRDGDAATQRIHRENADRMCLASFVASLTGNPGRFVRFSNPQDLSQTLATAVNKNTSPHHLLQKRNPLTDMQQWQRIIYWSNQTEPHTTLLAAYTIRKKQQPSTSIRSTYPSQPALVRTCGQNNGPA